jgi:hypothetical protein
MPAAVVMVLLMMGTAQAQMTDDPGLAPWVRRIGPYLQSVGKDSLLAQRCGLWSDAKETAFIGRYDRIAATLAAREAIYVLEIFTHGQNLAVSAFAQLGPKACGALEPRVLKTLEDLAGGQRGFWEWP